MFIRRVLSVSLFLRLRSFFCGAVFLSKTNRRARLYTTSPDSPIYTPSLVSFCRRRFKKNALILKKRQKSAIF
nr:MAG TPA: hypothetical protein [Caudoviricetes sp.]